MNDLDTSRSPGSSHYPNNAAVRERHGGRLASYFEATKDIPSAIRYDALVHWLDPANRSAFVSLRLNVERSFPKFFDPDELAGKKQYWALKPHPTVLSQIKNDKGTLKKPDRNTSPARKEH